MDSYYEELPNYEAREPQDVQHDAQVLIDAFIHPVERPDARTPSGVLPMPFCLPQIGTGFDTPFARGYNQVLHHVGISQEMFLDFVDGLNMAMISSPPLQVVNAAGLIIGFVPHWTFMLAGALMQTGAQVGMHVMSKTLSDRYLRAANERMFAPLGLRVRLCKTSALRTLVDHPEAGKPEPTKLKKVGQTAGDIILRLPLPIVKTIVRFVMDKPPPIDPRITDPLTRRLMVMQGYILPVLHGPALPPPSNPSNVLDKMNGFAILAGMPVTREGGLTRKDYRTMEEVSRNGTRRLKDKVDADARREHRANENLIWLVIINEADDAKISGKDAVDSSSDTIAFNDQQLEETRERYLEESNRDEYELEDYAPRTKEGRSRPRNDAGLS
ncbi:hypothetical protein SCHPADRAFT_996883 [Schizopora paradoxa]|uniref:Uncharacterized protein n=1 Tax=Schizopora paradoxa TaxID=27342 RepID=A0A0H2RXB1_9AGAM|nr:hypothetical protein SCHPADRAFT_996883 [Schizopora paradoxa]